MSVGNLIKKSMKWFQTESMDETEFFARWTILLNSERAKHRQRQAEYRKTYPEKELETRRASYNRHRLRRQQDARNKRLKMKSDPVRLDKYRRYCRERARHRVKNDPEFAIRKRMRTRIIMALKRVATEKSKHTAELVGCSMTQLRKHIESLWKPGMSWANCGRGGWHIDRKKPCVLFDLTNVEQQKICFHYTNLQPLWEFENLSKGARQNVF